MTGAASAVIAAHTGSEAANGLIGGRLIYRHDLSVGATTGSSGVPATAGPLPSAGVHLAGLAKPSFAADWQAQLELAGHASREESAAATASSGAEAAESSRRTLDADAGSGMASGEQAVSNAASSELPATVARISVLKTKVLSESAAADSGRPAFGQSTSEQTHPSPASPGLTVSGQVAGGQATAAACIVRQHRSAPPEKQRHLDPTALASLPWGASAQHTLAVATLPNPAPVTPPATDPVAPLPWAPGFHTDPSSRPSAGQLARQAGTTQVLSDGVRKGLVADASQRNQDRFSNQDERINQLWRGDGVTALPSPRETIGADVPIAPEGASPTTPGRPPERFIAASPSGSGSAGRARLSELPLTGPLSLSETDGHSASPATAPIAGTDRRLADTRSSGLGLSGLEPWGLGTSGPGTSGLGTSSLGTSGLGTSSLGTSGPDLKPGHLKPGQKWSGSGARDRRAHSR